MARADNFDGLTVSSDEKLEFSAADLGRLAKEQSIEFELIIDWLLKYSTSSGETARVCSEASRGFTEENG